VRVVVGHYDGRTKAQALGAETREEVADAIEMAFSGTPPRHQRPKVNQLKDIRGQQVNWERATKWAVRIERERDDQFLERVTDGLYDELAGK
jgi:hypothetical protein